MLSNLGNFQGINLETDICVITLDDNLTHTYCSKIKWEKDNYSPIGVAQLVIPFDNQISNYWSTYSGTVIIHANLGFITHDPIIDTVANISLNLKKMQNVESKIDKQNKKIRLQNDYYNFSFIGKVQRFKQVGKTFFVYIEDLGWKFMQKVPKEFRDSYISGQKLGDAFQSICEFMGIEFAYSIEDLNEFSFSADGYSVEKDGQVIEDVPSLLSEWKAPKDENSTDKNNTDEQLAENLDHQGYENAGLVDHDLATQSNNQSNSQSTTQTGNQVNNQSTNQSTAQSFDDLTIKLQMDFDEKIKDLFKGNTMYNSNISDPILNYDWITQKASQTTTEENEQENNQEGNQIGNQLNNQEQNEATT